MSEIDVFGVDEAKKKRDAIVSRYEERNRGDFRKVLSLPEGRRVMWRILCEGRIHRSCFDLNALQMAFNEGRRDIALFIEGEILKSAPEMIEKMRAEASTDRLIRENELLKSEKGEKENG